VAGRALGLQFMLAELELAVTFCRIVRSKRANTDRLLKNARNALFDACTSCVVQSWRPANWKRLREDSRSSKQRWKYRPLIIEGNFAAAGE